MTECHKELQQLMDSQVSVVTNDGRTMFGTLKGLDQKLNVILEECKERVFSKEEGVEEVGQHTCADDPASLGHAISLPVLAAWMLLARHQRSFRSSSYKCELQVTLGLYIIRGDNIAIVGEVDEQVDGATDWSKTKAEPLKHIVH